MQIFQTAWLNSYIGIWLLFQGVISLSPLSNSLSGDLPPDGSLKADSALMALPQDKLTPATSSRQPAADLSRSDTLSQPWRLPQTSAPSASVRVAQRSQTLKPESLSYQASLDNRSCPDHQTPAALPFQVLVNEQVVAEFDGRGQAYQVEKRLKAALDSAVGPEALELEREGEAIVGRWRQQHLFTVTSKLSQQIGQSREAIAVTWINALREALGQSPLGDAEVKAALGGLSPTGKTFEGVASWYGPYFHGRKTASGERFNQNELTAAHPTLPFDTHLKVTNQVNGRSVIVRINDRGPYVGRRSLDLSRQAARCLNSEAKGVVPFHATILQPS